ncbi:MAG: Aminopeptidase family protein [Bacteroidetes bacterium]|nr:Aminopeptidase family protein [Bacteroidota bacterium]
MIRRRVALLRESMEREGLDAFIVSSMPNIRYLTGFSGTSGLCIVRGNESFFLTDGRYVIQSKMEVKQWKRLIVSDGLLEEVARRKLLKRCRRVGFESQAVTYAQYRAMRKLVGAVSFVSTKDIVENIALVKDKQELDTIREAVRTSDRVFHDVLRSIMPGVAELDIAAEISYLHKKYGAEKDAFDPIVASGERGSLPHARASTKRIRNGEMVTLDFGCTVRGYNSDITRTVAVGKASARARKVYEVVRRAQFEAVQAAKADMLAKDLDGVARGWIQKKGYGKYFNHSLGHGLGLQVHERPRVSFLSKERLKEGSVITVEPGVYIPGFGGVRIEDDIVLTSNGCEVLNTAPKEFLIV